MKKLATLTGAVALAATAAMPVQAEMFWSDNSLTLLHSADYQVAGTDLEQELTTLTFEHVSGHNWGDAFMFIDRHNGRGDASGFNEIYGEISPRFSLNNICNAKHEFGPIKDVLIATTYEMNNFGTPGVFSGDQDNYLYGVGLDWTVPGFAFFQTNFYYADNENQKDDLQVTVVYGAPFNAGGVDFMFDGYIDWSTGESGDHASDFHFNPQLRANVGKFIGMDKSKLEAGIEYSYWNNKFGVKNDDAESAVSAIVKYHL